MGGASGNQTVHSLGNTVDEAAAPNQMLTIFAIFGLALSW